MMMWSGASGSLHFSAVFIAVFFVVVNTAWISSRWKQSRDSQRGVRFNLITAKETISHKIEWN